MKTGAAGRQTTEWLGQFGVTGAMAALATTRDGPAVLFGGMSRS